MDGLNKTKESMGRNGVVAATAAACILLLILLTSGQLQLASAESEIGRCYDDCLPDCEQGSSRAGCKLFCFTCCVLKPIHNCTRGGESTAAAAAPVFAGDAGCRELCTSSIGDAATGESRATDADVAACVDSCNSYKEKN
ncbi:Os02g0134700 [Oryza sativa Japonica Group]|uniref:Os02g0134700 protein n=3 Tax=Oryza sativa TaxID=4530 RepID=C7IZ73_ORYSJ|nr:Os02g0134700 [Oryza sativa Japonica Group]|eukprot:NP_001172790.1 Os02g0134700 [Oryza sativa Japonica Group]